MHVYLLYLRYETIRNTNNISENDSIINNVTPKNEHFLELNNKILQRVQGESKVYLSIDNVNEDDNGELNSTIPLEFLNL